MATATQTTCTACHASTAVNVYGWCRLCADAVEAIALGLPDHE
jgi:hypothetical protein